MSCARKVSSVAIQAVDQMTVSLLSERALHEKVLHKMVCGNLLTVLRELGQIVFLRTALRPFLVSRY